MLGREFLIEQGMCCGSGCFLCRYIPKHVAGSKRIRMEKYKNKDGIELSYTGNDSHQVLVKEVIGEAIKILSTYDRSCKISMSMSIHNAKKFLKTNFNIGENE